jgi:hypothetical protein
VVRKALKRPAMLPPPTKKAAVTAVIGEKKPMHF